MTTVEFYTVREALDHRFVGNHFSDREALEALDRLCERLCAAGRWGDAARVHNHTEVRGMGGRPGEAADVADWYAGRLRGDW